MLWAKDFQPAVRCGYNQVSGGAWQKTPSVELMTNISPNGFSSGSYGQEPHGQVDPGHQPPEQQQSGYQEPSYQQQVEQGSQLGGAEHTAVWTTAPVPATVGARQHEPDALLADHTAQHNLGAVPFIPSDGREAKKILYVGAVALLSMAVLAALVAAIGIKMNQSASESTPLPAAPTTAPLPLPTSVVVPPQVAPTSTSIETTTTTGAETTTTQATTTTIPSSLTISTITSFYQNCEEARTVGVAPMAIGSPGYRIGLDSDGDGLACNEPITATTQAVGTTTSPNTIASTTIITEPTSSTTGKTSTTGPATTVPITTGPISSVTATSLPPTSTPSTTVAVTASTPAK